MPDGDGGHPTVTSDVGVSAGEPAAAADEMQRGLSKMVDLRGLTKLTTFSGAEADWADWRFRTKALGPLLGISGIFEAAERSVADPPEETWSDADRMASQLLWSILSQTVQGRAYSILRMTQEGRGATAWFRIFQDYQMPNQIPRQMSILVGLLEPRFGNDVSTFLDKFLLWERRLSDLAANSGIVLPEAVKCAILMTKAPKPIRRFLENQAVIVQQSYPAMRQAMQLYLYRNRSFDADGTATAMEVDQLDKDGNAWQPGFQQLEDWGNDYEDEFDEEDLEALMKGGKGKGKGKSKGKSKGKPGYLAVVPGGQPGGDALQNAKRWSKWKTKKKDQQVSDAAGGSRDMLGRFAGHQQQQQQQLQQRQSTQTGGGGSAFAGNCHRCGKPGHKAKDCRMVFPIEAEEFYNTLAEEDRFSSPSVFPTNFSEVPSTASALQRRLDLSQLQSPVRPGMGPGIGPVSFQSLSSRPSMTNRRIQPLFRTLCEPRHEDLVRNGESAVEELQQMEQRQPERGGCWLLLIDSGAWIHCLPLEWGSEYPIIPYDEEPLPIVTADGTQVRKYGWRRIPCQLEEGVIADIWFEVLGIRRPILAVNMLAAAGFNVLFPAVEGEGSVKADACMWNKDHVAKFVQVGVLNYLPVFVESQRPQLLASLEDFHIPEDASWLLIEWCCDQDSQLAKAFADGGQCAWRMSLPSHDVRSHAERQHALEIAKRCLTRGLKVFVWYAFECRDWCAWQYVNEVRGTEDFQEQLIAGRLESRRMINQGFRFYTDVNFAAESLFGKPQDIRTMRVFGAFEWPQTCAGWKQSFMQCWHAIFPVTLLVDGCMFGLQADNGMPVRKRWKIKTDFLPLRSLKTYQCKGDHEHAECRGRVAAQSAFYLPEMAKTICRTIIQQPLNFEVDFVAELDEAVEVMMVTCNRCGSAKVPREPCPVCQNLCQENFVVETFPLPRDQRRQQQLFHFQTEVDDGQFGDQLSLPFTFQLDHLPGETLVMPVEEANEENEDTDPDMPELIPADSEEEESSPEKVSSQFARKQWRRSVDPPTPRTRALHSRTHIPFASWCRVCVSAKGKAKWRRRRIRKSKQTKVEDQLDETGDASLPVIEFDYWFPGLADGQGTVTVLIAVIREKGYGFACQVSSKGTADNTAIKEVLRWLLEAGVTGAARFRSDGESSIQAVVQLVSHRRGKDSEVIVEIAPKRTNGGMGTLNRFAETLGGQLRALMQDTEERLQIEVRLTSPAFGAMVKHSAWLLNRFQKWHGDQANPIRTPFEILQRRPYEEIVFAFAESVMARMVQQTMVYPKLQPRWEAGLWFGHSPDSDEHLVATVGSSPQLIATRDVQPISMTELPLNSQWKWWFAAKSGDSSGSSLDREASVDDPSSGSAGGGFGGAVGSSEGSFSTKATSSQRHGSQAAAKEQQGQDGAELDEQPFRYKWEVLPTGQVMADKTVHKPQFKHFAHRSYGSRAGQPSPWCVRLRAFHEECGKTPNCHACENAGTTKPGGVHHSFPCLRRQGEWEKQHNEQRKVSQSRLETSSATSAHGADTTVLGEPDVTMASEGDATVTFERGEPSHRLSCKTSMEHVRLRPPMSAEDEEPRKFRQVEIPEQATTVDDRVVQEFPSTSLGDEMASDVQDADRMEAALRAGEDFPFEYLNEEDEAMENYVLCAIFGDTFFDDVTGQRLDASEVGKAKQKERALYGHGQCSSRSTTVRQESLA